MKNILTLCLFLLSGCAAMHRPETSLSYSPILGGFRFHDTKDNDVTINGLKVNPDTKNIELESFVLRNNASDPINAFVNQMVAQAEINRVTIETLNSMTSQVMSIVSPLIADMINNQPEPVEPADLAIDPVDVLGPVIDAVIPPN